MKGHPDGKPRGNTFQGAKCFITNDLPFAALTAMSDQCVDHPDLFQPQTDLKQQCTRKALGNILTFVHYIRIKSVANQFLPVLRKYRCYRVRIGYSHSHVN